MLLLQFVVTVAIGVFLLQAKSVESVLGNLRNFRSIDFIGIALLLAAQHTLVAVRLRMIARSAGAKCTFSTALRAVLVGAFLRKPLYPPWAATPCEAGFSTRITSTQRTARPALSWTGYWELCHYYC